MKLFAALLVPLILSRTLLDEAQDAFEHTEEEDLSYSNGKLSNSRLVRIFPQLGSKLVDIKQALLRNDTREYYSIVELPEKAFTILIENLENYVYNHIEKMGDLTIEDVLATDKIETLSVKDFLYIMIFRYYIFI